MRRVPRSPRRRSGVRACLGAALLLPLVAACGGQPSLTLAGLGVPIQSHPSILGHNTYETSPDGGIYVNPDPIKVTLVGRIPMEPLAQQLKAGHQWAALSGLGDLTVVGFQLSNAGLAGSSPQLNNLQIASSSWATCESGTGGALCPPGVSRSVFNQFYYPAYPLAGLSTISIDGSCSISVDPGQTATVLLVYPPIRSTSYLTWGEYGTFAIALPLGGGLPPAPNLRASVCAQPDVQAS